MKRLILLLLLLSSIVSQTYSQDSIRYWITSDQQVRILQLRDDNRTLSIGIQFLQQENAGLRFENDSLQETLDALTLKNQLKLDSIRKVLYRDSAKISMLEKGMFHSKKVIVSKDNAIDKWKREYYQILKFKQEFVFNSIKKWFEIAVTAVALGAAIFIGMEIADQFQLTLTL